MGHFINIVLITRILHGNKYKIYKYIQKTKLKMHTIGAHGGWVRERSVREHVALQALSVCLV